MATANSKSVRTGGNASLYLSKYLFLLGLSLVTFEEVRPGGIMLSDYCFLLSLVFLPKSRLLSSTRSGVLLAGSLILSGAVLSLHGPSSWADAAGTLLKLFLLFGLIAPLALSHSKDIYKNLLFLAGGIFVNCLIVLIQAWVFPGIVDLLSINPPQADVAFSGRYQGLTEFPVTLGLSAALGALIGIGLFSTENSRLVRWGLIVLVLVCTVAALLSGSRTFLASLVPGLIVFVFLQKKRRLSVLYATGILVVSWGALTYLAPGMVSQYSERIDSVGLVDYRRLGSSAQAVLEISEKPIRGWGVDHFDEGGVVFLPDTGEITGAHNTFLRYWYAAGLLGASGFLMLFVSPARRILAVLKERMAEREANAARLALAACVFFFIVSNLGPYLYNRYLYVPMFVFAGFSANCVGLIAARKAAHQTIARLPSTNMQVAS